MKAGRTLLRRMSFAILVTALAVAGAIGVSTRAAHAAVGGTLRTLHPAPTGNGRAMAVDPATGHLYYTNSDDPHIYVTDTAGNYVQTITPNFNGDPAIFTYGALSWQQIGTGGVLWGGRYDGSGAIDVINPLTGRVTPRFRFPFPADDSCYEQGAGAVDGIAFDVSDGTLWVGDDGARSYFHVRRDGTLISRVVTPGGFCRSGIAVNSQFVWLGLQSGPDAAPYLLGRVAKGSSNLLQTVSLDSGAGPEGLALDRSTFPGKCAVWVDHFGVSTTLSAVQLQLGQCDGIPQFPSIPQRSLRSVGLLTFHDPSLFACVATVVDSANLSTVVTAKHCFGHSTVRQIEFAPAHTGTCLGKDVDQCGGNPFGVWYATGSDIHTSNAGSPGQSDDFAFVVVKPRGNKSKVEQAVGGFPITWDHATNPSADPLQHQTWRVTSYASDDRAFVSEAGGFGPFECDWVGSIADPVEGNGTLASPAVIGAYLDTACSFVDPVTGTEAVLNYPTPIQGCSSNASATDQCHRAQPFGSSGSPWTNNLNTPDGHPSIGAIQGTSYRFCDGSPACNTGQGNKLGTDAQAALVAAESQHVP
jgi:hypothetical protein